MSGLKALFTLPFVVALAAAQTPCDQLKLSLPDTTVNSIQFVPAGPFAAPDPTIPAVDVAPVPPGRGAGRLPHQTPAAHTQPSSLGAPWRCLSSGSGQRRGDLNRFIFLLSGSDGEPLFGPERQE